MSEVPPGPIRIAAKPATRHRVRTLLLWSLGVLLVYGLLGFLVLPPIVKSVLTRQLSERLHRETTIRKVRINPFTLTVQVQGFSMKDRGVSGAFVSFEELYLDLEVISLIKGGPVFREIRLMAPHISVIRNDDLTYNFSDLLEQFSETPGAPPKTPKPAPLRFSLNNIQILGGQIDFDDRPKHARHAVTDLALTIPFVSNLPVYIDVFVQPAFRATVNGTPIVLVGKTKPFTDSRETSLDISVQNFDLPKYLEYVPFDMKFKILSGTLETKLSLSFREYRDKLPVLLVKGTLALHTLAVRDADVAPVLDLPLLAVDIESADVFAKKVTLRSILIQAPKLSVRRDKTGSLNLLSLLPRAETGEASKGTQQKSPPSTPLEFQAAEVRITDGIVSLRDDSLDKPFQMALRAINIVVGHVSNIPKQAAALDVSLQTDGGETVKHTGSFTLEPFAAAGTVELLRLRVKRYAPYYGSRLLFDVEDGLISASTRYTYNQPEGQTLLSALSVSAASVRLKRKGDTSDFVTIPAFTIKQTDIDLVKRSILLGEVMTSKGTIVVTRDNDGSVNLGKLVAPSPPNDVKTTSAQVPKEAAVSPWLVTLKRMSIDRYAVKIEDHVPSDTAKLVVDPISITAENLSTGKDRRGKISVHLTLNKSAELSIAGTLVLEPPSGNLMLDLKNLDMIPLQPYFTDRVKIIIASGAVSAHGNLIVNSTAEKRLATSFSGDLALTKLIALDKTNSDDFLKWEALSVHGISFGTDPFHVDIKDISLTDFYSRLIVNADGTLNVTGVLASQGKGQEAKDTQSTPAPSQAVAQPPTAPPAIRIDTVTLQGGTVNFSDHFIKPNYSAMLTQLTGHIASLSSDDNQRADVDIRGQLGNGAPLEIIGKINPLGKDLFVDLHVDFKDIELSPMTPYSGKYAGYTIEKGKLSLTLKYLIEHRKVQAENKVFIDQFTFGEKVDSPDATKLPVRFAISLLKDRNGAINLDVPVAGSLNDPQFSVWGVVMQVITNLLTKAATSPFALLGSLGGGGPELSYVEFDYGSAQIDGTAEAKLQKLAKILYERPALKLDVTGRTEAEKDQEALRQQQFDRKIRAQKLNEIVKKGGASTSPADIKVASDEYPKYLTLAYKNEPSPKPRNLLGFTKDVPVPEMEKFILAHITVTEDDLRQLAMRRAQAVKDYLQQAGKIEPERMFLVTGERAVSEKKEQLKNSRVDLAIR